MTLTRQCFETIAEVIRQLDATAEDRHAIAVAFANRLAGTNPRFDRHRFVLACTRTV